MRNALACFVIATTQLLAAQMRTIATPCNLTDFSVAADGTGVWVICRTESDKEKAADEAGRKTTAPPVGSRNDPSEVYWVDLLHGGAQRAASASGAIDVYPSPKGHMALLVLPQERSWGEVFVYDAATRQRKLPIDAYTLAWGSDASRVYFYGGTTLQADVWNILATYSLETGKTVRRKLVVPTEIVGVCGRDGHVFTTTPAYPGSAGATIEYDSDLRFIRWVRRWIGARFSANCRYVASEQSYHGPLPWSVYDISTERRLFHFDYFGDEGKEDSFELIAWNPARESLMLRRLYPLGKEPADLQVFDVAMGRVRLRLPDSRRGIAWSADGRFVLMGCRRAIEFHEVN